MFDKHFSVLVHIAFPSAFHKALLRYDSVRDGCSDTEHILFMRCDVSNHVHCEELGARIDVGSVWKILAHVNYFVVVERISRSRTAAEGIRRPLCTSRNDGFPVQHTEPGVGVEGLAETWQDTEHENQSRSHHTLRCRWHTVLL